jgi:formylmethanofuran dehydrogenase subunit D
MSLGALVLGCSGEGDRSVVAGSSVVAPSPTQQTVAVPGVGTEELEPVGAEGGESSEAEEAGVGAVSVLEISAAEAPIVFSGVVRRVVEDPIDGDDVAKARRIAEIEVTANHRGLLEPGDVARLWFGTSTRSGVEIAGGADVVVVPDVGSPVVVMAHEADLPDAGPLYLPIGGIGLAIVEDDSVVVPARDDVEGSFEASLPLERFIAIAEAPQVIPPTG